MRGYAFSLRIIVITLLLFVITANLTLFIFTQNGYVGNTMFTDRSFVFDRNFLFFAHYEYKGFKEFFEFMGTFPGLNMSLSSINEVASILSGQLDYLPQSLVVLDWVIKFVQIITLPIKLVFTFVGDIINIIIWFGSWLIPTMLS